MQRRIGRMGRPARPWHSLWLPADRLAATGLLKCRTILHRLSSHRLSLIRMTARACLVAALAVACALVCEGASAASPNRRLPVSPPRQEPMIFYVVKGAPDSCGRGCDSWIEAEGKIESGTAARLKVFLDRLRNRNLPIYFASPGGNLDQAVMMGGMLHAKPTIARVGRTLVRECGFEAQDSEICVKFKQSGRELHGDLFTRGAICASACPYVFAGAAVHEIAPDAVLAVHSPKIFFTLHGGPVDPSVVAAATERGHERADRMVATYLAKVGIDAGLLGLTKTVKFEDIHILTRDEIARFGLDRRGQVETPWKFENDKFSMMHKVAVVQRPGEKSFRLLQWRVACVDAKRLELDFQRPALVNASFASVSIASNDAKPTYFVYPPATAPGIEQWGLRMPQPALQSLLDRPEIEFIETSLGADGHRLPQTIKLSNDGWDGALGRLLAVCPHPRDSAAAQASQSGDTTAK